MRFFFYGTVMDCDLLSRALVRPIAPNKLAPARLRGYRRSAVQGLPYPVVLREPTASVKGPFSAASLQPSPIDFAAMKARTIF